MCCRRAKAPKVDWWYGVTGTICHRDLSNESLNAMMCEQIFRTLAVGLLRKVESSLSMKFIILYLLIKDRNLRVFFFLREMGWLIYRAIKVICSPTNALVIFLKTILKFTLKKAPTSFGAVTPSSGSSLFVLAKVTLC